MKPVDVPQADSLSRVRELIQTVQFGAVDTARLQLVMTLHPRHVGYHIHAARVLCWLEKNSDQWQVTALGTELLQTNAGSQEERAIFRKSINDSEHLMAIAPELLGDEDPEQDLLANSIQDVVGMAPATARRRASTLLRWRTQSMPTRPRRAETFTFDDDATIKESVRVHAIHVESFGLLRSVRVEMGENPVLVGDNGTGKSTLLDVFKFIEDALTESVSRAIEMRGDSLRDILWFGEGEAFGLAVEFSLPKRIRHDHARARYELEIGQLDDGGVGVRRESFYLMPREAPQASAVQQATPRGWRKVFGLTQNGQARYGSEDPVSRKTTTAPVGNNALALARLPDDSGRFMAALRVRALLMGGVRLMDIDASAIAQSCPTDSDPVLASDGAGFARVAHALSLDDADRFKLWERHVSEAIPHVESIRPVESDGMVSMRVTMKGGLELPVSRLSEGSLRVLGATIIPYQSEADTLFVVESPETGIHPKGIEPLAQALSDAGDTQVVVTTYSPLWVGCVPMERLRCFVREAGGVRVVPGSQVEILQGEDGPVATSYLFSAGFMS